MKFSKRVAALAASVVVAGAAMAADTQASFPGGESALNTYLTENVKYPQTSRDCGIEGVVVVVFTVKADGAITNPKILRPVDPDLENEALRVVKGMPSWSPATVGGAAVDSQVQLPVKFRL